MQVDDDKKEKITLDFVLSQSIILATELQILGCKPGRVVGIICENRLEYPIIFLSVLNTGAALCCFNPNYSRGKCLIRIHDFTLRSSFNNKLTVRRGTGTYYEDR